MGVRVRKAVLVLLGIASGIALILPQWQARTEQPPDARTEVVFWHFWGGRDRAIVDNVVDRFNRSQQDYWVRAIAIPGNNFDAKLFLSVVGEHPPDVINQDDPVLADWSALGVLQPVADFAGESLVRELDEFLLPAARRLAEVDDQLVAVPNGLDVRAIYYNGTLLDQLGIPPPTSLPEFDKAVLRISPQDNPLQHGLIAFLPDPRRVWSWAYVFGGDFWDESTQTVTADSPPVVEAVEWMTRFSQAYGADFAARYRQTDQNLPGKIFAILPAQDDQLYGRYAMVLDGQWRVRDLEEFDADRAARGIPAPRWGVLELPAPPGGRPRGGWINGNFFIVPRGAKNPQGAVAFMRFWIGLSDPDAAAETCAAGGWIPVSQKVIDSPRLQAHVRAHPLLAPFVQWATSENLFPYPPTRSGMFVKRTLETAAEEAVNHPERSAKEILREAAERIGRQVQRVQSQPGVADAR